MPRSKVCLECGARLARKPWRVWEGQFCKDCAPRFRKAGTGHLIIAASALILLGFTLGRYTQTQSPPLLIERAANSPLSNLSAQADGFVELSQSQRTGDSDSFSMNGVAGADRGVNDSNSAAAVYICGARTKKGSPCHRHVHTPGERCYQHKGMPAILPLEKLAIKPR